MVKLFRYGCSYGLRSSRKLERACHHNISFIWLMGGLKPDHKTIANLRRNHKKAWHGMIKPCAQICVKRGGIEGHTLFVDGPKIRTNAPINNALTQEKDKAERGEKSHIK